MILQEQLAQSQQPSALLEFFPTDVAIRAGLLGDAFGQMLANAANLTPIFPPPLNEAESAFRLVLLKQQRFSPEGREYRIATSLAAVNAPQPTNLTLAEWKEIVESIEDDED
jgi:hypothetical protein